MDIIKNIKPENKILNPIRNRIKLPAHYLNNEMIYMKELIFKKKQIHLKFKFTRIFYYFYY